MNPQDYAVLSGFLKAASGLALTPEKVYLLTSRLQPVAQIHGMKTIADVAQALRLGGTERLKQDVIEAMTTNETSFFRDGTPFEMLRTHVLNELFERRKAARTIRVLCAAASSGQEPYSIAMILAEAFAKVPGWTADILGIDIDSKILAKAEQGLYTQLEVQRGLPVQMLTKYMEQRADQTWQVKPAIRGLVRYRRCNLVQPFGDLGQFDIVFCRNVLIYFDNGQKRDVLNRLCNHMPRDGYLFLGGAETVIDITDRFAPVPGKRGLYAPNPAAVKVAV